MKQRIYAIAAVLTAIMIACATAVTAQGQPEGIEGINGTPAKISVTDKDSAIIIIDRCVSTPEAMQALKPEQIKEFSVYKMGKNNLMEITTINPASGDGTPLVLVNGLEIDSLQQVRGEYVRTVTSLQPDKAMEIYGSRGARGAVLITMHRTYDGKPVSMRAALSGNEIKTQAGEPEVIKVIGTRKPDAAEIIHVIGKSSLQPKADQPLTLGREEGNDTTYLIPDLNKVKPEEIASISVFKDKSSAMFDAYGDTSGGVILVTFKKGRMPLSAVVKAGNK